MWGMTIGGVSQPAHNLVTSPFATFTKYSGSEAPALGGNTNPLFTPSEIFQKTPVVPEALLRTSFAQHSGIAWSSHWDWIAYQYGFNGYTTPDGFNSGRQEWHRIDFLLQDNNPNWPGNLGTINGTVLNIPNIETLMTNNVAPNVGYQHIGTGFGFHANMDLTSNAGQFLLGGSFDYTEIWDSLSDNVMTWNDAHALATAGADDPNSTFPDQHFCV